MDQKNQILKCERSFEWNYLHHQALLWKSFAHILHFEFYWPHYILPQIGYIVIH